MTINTSRRTLLIGVAVLLTVVLVIVLAPFLLALVKLACYGI